MVGSSREDAGGGHPPHARVHGEALMRARQSRFLEVFRAPNPLGSDGFRLVCDTVAATPDPGLLQDFFAAMNRDLVAGVERGAARDLTWAVDLCVTLVRVSPEATLAALGTLVGDGLLWFHDPVIAVAFEAASRRHPCWTSSPTSSRRSTTCSSFEFAPWRPS